MILGKYPYNVLRRNFQTISTNRFVVDSPRFWRQELHPHFYRLFEVADFYSVISSVNDELSFKWDDDFITKIAKQMHTWFSGYRFAYIPCKDPLTPDMFLSELFFTLLDILPQIQFSQWKLTDDDFNVVNNTGETGKVDTTKLSTNERNNQKNISETTLGINSLGRTSQQNIANVENIDEQTDQNTKTVNDTFLSAQNQGQTPISQNTKGQGVDGITLSSGAAFTTNTNNQNVGDTTVNKSNTSSATSQADSELQQNNDMGSSTSIQGEIGQDQLVDNTAVKDDKYRESLDFDRGEKLHQFFDLNSSRLWLEILKRMSFWVLSVSIATSDTNYNCCPVYEDGYNPIPVNFVTLVYNSNGGTGTATFTLEEGEDVGILRYDIIDIQPPARGTFVEWNTLADGTGKSYNPGDTVTLTENLTLFAIWNIAPAPTYTITFDANGGEGGASFTVTQGNGTAVLSYEDANIIPPADKIFYRWNSSPDGTGQDYVVGSTFVPTGDTTLYAIYINEFIWVTYQPGDNGTGGSTARVRSLFIINVKNNEDAKVLPNSGYAFDKWLTDDGVEYDPGETIFGQIEDITFVAQWRRLESRSITYNANGGTGSGLQEGYDGDEFIIGGIE